MRSPLAKHNWLRRENMRSKVPVTATFHPDIDSVARARATAHTQRARGAPGAERGSATAEFAAVVPAIAVVLALCLGGVQTLAQQVRLADAAGDAVRALARGEGEGRAHSIAETIAGAVGLSVAHRGEFVCLQLSAAAAFGPFAAAGVRVAAESCALDGGR